MWLFWVIVKSEAVHAWFHSGQIICCGDQQRKHARCCFFTEVGNYVSHGASSIRSALVDHVYSERAQCLAQPFLWILHGVHKLRVNAAFLRSSLKSVFQGEFICFNPANSNLPCSMMFSFAIFRRMLCDSHDLCPSNQFIMSKVHHLSVAAEEFNARTELIQVRIVWDCRRYWHQIIY